MKNKLQRRGAVLVLAAILMVFMTAMLAFAVDLGLLMSARTEMQRSADAAALAAGWAMVSDDAVRGDMSSVDTTAREMAVNLAGLNEVVKTKPSLDMQGDIKFGYLADPTDLNEKISFFNPSQYNAVQVDIEYSAGKNTPISLFFAPVIGITSADLAVSATATFSGGNTSGFRITEKTGKCSLMPFTVKNEDWQDLLKGKGDDNWAYDPETGEVSPGQDGIPELNMFPQNENSNNGKGGGGITPGNFGTVDIGNTNNAATDLWRQIEEGPNLEDFSYYPNNELKLDPKTGTVDLNGDTGITASMKDSLDKIIGQPRTILLYKDADEQGNNTWFTIDGFAGIRVMDFSLTGGDKYILIQPSNVADASAVTGDANTSNFVGPPVHLVR